MKILYKLFLTITLLFTVAAADTDKVEAGEIDPEVARIIYMVSKDSSWVSLYQDDNSFYSFNTRFVLVQGSKDKPKIDVWVAYIQNGEIESINRVRYYFSKNKVQRKILMVGSFCNNSLFECYQTGIYSSKEDVIQGSIGDVMQKGIYDTCYRYGYLDKLK